MPVLRIVCQAFLFKVKTWDDGSPIIFGKDAGINALLVFCPKSIMKHNNAFFKLCLIWPARSYGKHFNSRKGVGSFTLFLQSVSLMPVFYPRVRCRYFMRWGWSAAAPSLVLLSASYSE